VAVFPSAWNWTYEIPNYENQLQPENQQLGLLSYLNGGEETNSFLTHETSQFIIQTFKISLIDVMENIFYDLDSNCATIPMWKTVCADDASSCQLANMEIQTSEDAIVILSQSLFSMRRVSEMPDYSSSDESIKICHNGLS